MEARCSKFMKLIQSMRQVQGSSYKQARLTYLNIWIWANIAMDLLVTEWKIVRRKLFNVFVLFCFLSLYTTRIRLLPWKGVRNWVVKRKWFMVGCKKHQKCNDNENECFLYGIISYVILNDFKDVVSWCVAGEAVGLVGIVPNKGP